MVSGGPLRSIWLGASHMFAGYDHLLFLLGVIFFLTWFTEVIKCVTAFTLGHSITLLLAGKWRTSRRVFLSRVGSRGVMLGLSPSRAHSRAHQVRPRSRAYTDLQSEASLQRSTYSYPTAMNGLAKQESLRLVEADGLYVGRGTNLAVEG